MTPIKSFKIETTDLSDCEKMSFNYLETLSEDFEETLLVEVVYESAEPISGTRKVIFHHAASGKSFELEIHVAADNSILSCYNFVAQRASTHRVIRTGGCNSPNFELKLVPFGDNSSRPMTRISTRNT